MKTLLASVLLVFSALAHSQEKQEIPVLMYHQITDSKPAGNTVVSPAEFRNQMNFLKAKGYTTVTASELTKILTSGKNLPNKTVAITLDDGWRSSLEAIRVFDELGMSATFYAVSGASTDSSYLTESELMLIAQNKKYEIGAHSHTHFMQWSDNLDSLDSRIMIGEIVMSKILLEKVIGKKVTSFAWPFGYVRDDVMDKMADMGFTSTMLVTNDSKNSVGMSPLRVRRINIDGRCNISDFEQMLQTKQVKACNDENDKKISR